MIKPLKFESFNDMTLATQFAKENGDGSVYIGGGTDLVVQTRSGKIKPKCVIDISSCQSLYGIKDERDRVEIGALVTIETLRLNPLIRRYFSALIDAANVFAAWQVRNAATLGGNICNASPAADTVPPLLAYSATVKVTNGLNERVIPLESFFKGPGKTVLERGELLTSIAVPKTMGGCAFLKLGKRQSSILAVVNVAALLETEDTTIQRARVALGSVAPTPVRARNVERFLEGKKMTESNLKEASKHVLEDISPINDIRGSARYRKDMSVVLTGRTLELAARRCVGSVIFK